MELKQRRSDVNKMLAKRIGVGDRGGFSLIELIFAICFLGIGLLGVATVFPMGTRFVNAAKVTSSGVAFAREKIEELQSAPANSTLLVEGQYSDSEGVFTRDWTVTDDTPMAGMKRLLVITAWETPQGTRRVALETYIFR
jgi:type II secretory pathway pseudopilin PulG